LLVQAANLPAELSIFTGITDSPATATTQNQMSFELRIPIVTQNQTIGHETTFCRFSCASSIKRDAPFGGVGVNKLFPAPPEITGGNITLRDPMTFSTSGPIFWVITSATNNPPLFPQITIARSEVNCIA
jgi:hypothetical protein